MPVRENRYQKVEWHHNSVNKFRLLQKVMLSNYLWPFIVRRKQYWKIPSDQQVTGYLHIWQATLAVGVNATHLLREDMLSPAWLCYKNERLWYATH